MEPLQLFLIVIGIAAASGGVLMLTQLREHGANARGPYVPLAIIFIGVMIAYRSYADYKTLDTLDFVIMFLFLFGLMALLGVQFFVVERYRRNNKN